jgi:hypothetical protein
MCFRGNYALYFLFPPSGWGIERWKPENTAYTDEGSTPGMGRVVESQNRSTLCVREREREKENSGFAKSTLGISHHTLVKMAS